MLNEIVIIVLGFLIGILTGFLGVGGGFIIMPSLLVLGIPADLAVGTSLSIYRGSLYCSYRVKFA